MLPSPDKLASVGEPAALLEICSVPVQLPWAVGANVTSKLMLPPGLMFTGGAGALWLKVPGQVEVGCGIEVRDRVALPVFETTKKVVALLFT